MSHAPVTKERLEAAKQKLIALEEGGKIQTPPDDIAEEPEVEDPIPFGGGYLIGLMVNPSSLELQQLQGYDRHGLSFSRSYGGSSYLPLFEHCKALIRSDSPAKRKAGEDHLNDRFMIIRDTSPPLTAAEQAMYNAAQDVGQQLLDKGAIAPLVFTKVEVLGHFGPEILKNHYIPSCGIDASEETIIEAFTAFMDNPDRWTLEII